MDLRNALIKIQLGNKKTNFRLSENADCLNFVFIFWSFMYTNSMNNSDKFRFVDATAKQIDMNDQLSQPRIGDTAFTIPADPNKKVWKKAL